MSNRDRQPGLGGFPPRDSSGRGASAQEIPLNSVFTSQLEAALLQVLEELGQLVHCRSATIQLESQGVLQIVAQRGESSLEGENASSLMAEDELYCEAVESRQPVIVPDLQQQPRGTWHAELDQVRGWLGVPLLDNDQVIGLLSVGSDQPDAFSTQDAQVVAAFASQAVAVTQNARLVQRLSRSEKLHKALQEVVALLNSHLDSDQILDEVLKQVERVLPFTSASIHLLDANRLYYAAGRGFPADSHPETGLSPGGNAILQQIAETKRPMLIEDVRSHPDWHVEPGLEYIRSRIGAPLIVKDRVIGYLTLDHRQVGAYTREDVQVSDTLARQVAVAIENARLYTETRRWAEEQAALNTIATAASSSLDMKKMLNHVLDAVKILFDVDATEVHLLAEGGGALSVATRRGRYVPPEATPPSAAGDDDMLSSGRDNGLSATSGDRPPEGDGEGSGEAVAAVALRSKEGLLGSLSITSYEGRKFTPREISLLEAISYQLSLAIENVRLYEELKQSEGRKTSLLRELEQSLQELQQAQAKLIQSEKLAAIGLLVSGVAHELNNPLTAIVGYAQILQASDLPSPAKADLDRIIEQAQRSARIIQKLLTFGRQHKPEQRPVDVNQLVEDVLDLVGHQLTMDQICVESQLSDTIPLTLADPYQLQQVWLNLIQNAQQAMLDAHRGGLLRIQTLTTLEGNIRVEFTDNGPGIAPDAMEKIFDPFFTTKPIGKGTGLGLSICYGIIQGHHGEIWVENNASGGSTFVVELPGLEDVAWDVDVEPASPTHASADARILVVDDEPSVLEMVKRHLTGQGYRVETARDGAEVAERIAREDYDLILLDILMPEKDGITTFREVVERWPDMGSRIIFATGDVATESTRAFLEETCAVYITKPFDLTKLIQVIRSTLERGRM